MAHSFLAYWQSGPWYGKLRVLSGAAGSVVYPPGFLAADGLGREEGGAGELDMDIGHEPFATVKQSGGDFGGLADSKAVSELKMIDLGATDALTIGAAPNDRSSCRSRM